jgi:hypothetical protein
MATCGSSDECSGFARAASVDRIPQEVHLAAERSQGADPARGTACVYEDFLAGAVPTLACAPEQLHLLGVPFLESCIPVPVASREISLPWVTTVQFSPLRIYHLCQKRQLGPVAGRRRPIYGCGVRNSTVPFTSPDVPAANAGVWPAL